MQLEMSLEERVSTRTTDQALALLAAEITEMQVTITNLLLVVQELQIAVVPAEEPDNDS